MFKNMTRIKSIKTSLIHLWCVGHGVGQATRNRHSRCRCTSHGDERPNDHAPPAVSAPPTEPDDSAGIDVTSGTCPVTVRPTPCLTRSIRTGVQPNLPLLSRTSSSARDNIQQVTS